MKLNIGASNPRGRYQDPQWINLEYSRHYRGVHRSRFVLADGTLLPFRDSTFDEIHAVHVLEHVPRWIVRRDGTKVDGHLSFVEEMRRVLTPDGVGYIEVPNFLGVIHIILMQAHHLVNAKTNEAMASHLEQIRIQTVGVFGKGRHEGDYHRWGFTPWGIESLFTLAQVSYRRESEMISAHYKQEPVMLYSIRRQIDHRSR